MEFIVIILLIILNGVFSMSELSLVSSKKYRLEQAAQKGSKSAKVALDLTDNPSNFLSTVQIGITLIGILLGVYSGDSVAKLIGHEVGKISYLAPFSSQIGTGVSVVLITYFSIVVGELFPKRLGLAFPERAAMIISRPMKLLSKIASPFVWLLTVSNNALLRVFGIDNQSDSKITEDEIKAIIKESTEGGEIQEIEQDIVGRVFELGDKRVNSLYTHRSDLVYFNESDDWSTVRQKINSEKHSAYPVCVEGNLDQIKGIVLLKDLFGDNNESFSLIELLKQPVFISENSSAFNVLELFRKVKMHCGVVVDEYGTTVGIVTMDDLMDALIGDATEHDQSEYQIVARNENSWLVDGYYNLDDFRKYFNLDIDPVALSHYTTVSGLFVHSTQSIPEVGERITIGNYTLEVVDKDRQRIDKIMVTRLVGGERENEGSV